MLSYVNQLLKVTSYLMDRHESGARFLMELLARKENHIFPFFPRFFLSSDSFALCVCVLTLRYTCELLLHEVWKWALPGSETSEHFKGNVLLHWNARSRLGRPLWDLPQQDRGYVTSHSHKLTDMTDCTWNDVLFIVTCRVPEAYPLLCRNKGYQRGLDDHSKGMFFIFHDFSLNYCCGIKLTLFHS